MGSDQFVEIGLIQRTHGINGELQIEWSQDFNLDHNFSGSVFIELDGIPVPFFITSLREKGADKALIKFEDVDSINTATELENHKLFLPEDIIKDDETLLMQDLVGYVIISDKGLSVGRISDYQEYQSNSVFTVLHQSGKELMVPASNDLIVDIDEEGQTVVMQIPDGLIDLYLE